MCLKDLSAVLDGQLRTNSAVFKMVTDCYRSGALPTMVACSESVIFSSVVSVVHEAILLQVVKRAFANLGHVGSPFYYFLCFASFRVNIKECSRKLNQHGHEWQMRVDQHAVDRKDELERFCERVHQDRTDNDESAEYNRKKDLETPIAFGSAVNDLAAISGGGDFDKFF